MNNDPNNEWVDLSVMQVLRMAMHATVVMLITSLSPLTLENVTSHALAILVSSVAARGVYKYLIPEIQMVTITNIQKLQLKVQRPPLNRK